MIDIARFGKEVVAAGLNGLPFSWDAEGVTYQDPEGVITDAQRAAIDALVEQHVADGMLRARQDAYTKAMTFGNTITAQVENQWASVERASFTAQEMEAKAVIAGETLADDAILPPVAAHKGVDVKVYAQQVLDNAADYRKMAVAAIILRRGAEALLSPDLDNPSKLQEAVGALYEQAEGFAKQMGLSLHV